MADQHVSEPWTLEVGDHTHRYVLVKDADDRTVHYKYGAGSAAEADKDEAHARLIAAAPALLEALNEMADVLGEAEDREPGSNPTDQWVFRYRAAQVKARAAITAATHPASLEGR